MVVNNYLRIPIRDDREKDFKLLKENLEKIGIANPTYDEVMGVLLEKNKRIIMNEKDIKDLIQKLRGIR
jgi:nitrogen regulatory protein PII